MRQCQHQKLAFAEFKEVIEPQVTFALFDLFKIVPAFAAGEQLAQPTVSRAVARIDQDIRRAVDKDEARADQQLRLILNFRVFQLLVGPHHAGQRVVIGDADHGKPQLACLMHIDARIRAAAQEREIRGDADLGIAGRWLNADGTIHANNPCTNQLAGAGLPSSVTSSLP